MEVWTDISCFQGKTAGAFVVDDGCVTTVELSGNLIGTRAETALMEHVIESLECSLVIHHDVKQMPLLMARGSVRPLQRLVEQYGVELRSDGRLFEKYRLCHHAARIAVGIYGSQHPLRILTKAIKVSEDVACRTWRLDELRRLNAKVKLRGGLEG